MQSHETAAVYAAVLDSLPLVTYVARPDGRVTFVSPAWRALIGQSEAVLGEGYVGLLHPDERERALAVWHAALRDRTDYRGELRLLFGDGTYRWVLTQAAPLRDAATGEVHAWVGTVTDIHESKLAEARLREHVAFTSHVLDSSDDIIAVLRLDGSVASLNRAGMRRLGAQPSAADAHRSWDDWWAPDDRPSAAAALERARTNDSGRFTGRMMLPDGARWFDVVVTPVGNGDGGVERILIAARDVSEQRVADEARVRLAEGLSLLARTGGALVAALDDRQRLESIAHACIDGFATYCIIDIFEDGDWERIVAHARPDLRQAIKDLTRPTGRHPIARTARTGYSGVIDVDEAWLRDVDAGEDRRSVTRRLEVRSVIVAPVRLPDGSVIGALTLGIDKSISRDYRSHDDLPIVEELGRRAGAAIAYARLFARNSRIAAELQAASLPLVLPRFEHLQIDAFYQPGSDEATIGGDWYDAFALEDGRVVITVGDVLGHGLAAAVVMTKLRQAMQSAAMVTPRPEVMLDVADRTTRMLGPDVYATALAAVYDHRTRTLTYASAGHPGPMTDGPDGCVQDAALSGVMLGIGEAAYEIRTLTAAPRSTIVFYTDGLIEAGRDLLAGQARLREALATVAEADAPARAIVRYVLDATAARDDIAVLVVRVVD